MMYIRPTRHLTEKIRNQMILLQGGQTKVVCSKHKQPLVTVTKGKGRWICTHKWKSLCSGQPIYGCCRCHVGICKKHLAEETMSDTNTNTSSDQMDIDYDLLSSSESVEEGLDVEDLELVDSGDNYVLHEYKSDESSSHSDISEYDYNVTFDTMFDHAYNQPLNNEIENDNLSDIDI